MTIDAPTDHRVPGHARAELADAFTVRPFAACLDAFSALGSGEPREQSVDGAGRAFAFEALEIWPTRPPHCALLEVDEPQLAVLADPRRLARLPVFAPLLGTWNARVTGHWFAGPGWIVAGLQFTHEQLDEESDASSDFFAGLALFAVEGGWAAAVWPARRHEAFAAVLGFAPERASERHPCQFWFGE
ncbi:hypothetical protein [Nannocystis punicea]|uniref:Uncharacterized protein n=1 Tax=Nannocystis punicea TaxID=2995304 RepID=A0ABY7H8W3_9BACT|nr:hypothetical protein [Nannocystis poenicansa]WAS95712.1 hypothetical protein O0S08_06080 [Nannocystis poenicansa]